MSENLVRDVHDAVARSDSVVEASARPPATSPRELRAMERDVLRKLQLGARTGVVEIGCGIALLGVPVARRAARYVGLDFAPQAVETARERLRAAGLEDRSRVLCMDVLSAAGDELDSLGRFERVLMYAAFHYARSESEAVCLLQRAFDLLAPAGRALIGNVPLGDLHGDWTAPEPAPRGPLARLTAAVRWVMTPGTTAVPLTRRWKARRTLEVLLKRRSPAQSFVLPPLPPGYTLSLTTAAVERWLASVDGEFVHHWELPAPGVPLAVGRADLIIERLQGRS